MTWACFIAFAWQCQERKQAIAVVNYAPNQSQCYLKLPWSDLPNPTYQLRDLMGTVEYNRTRDSLLISGLYLDMPAWAYHVFELF